MTPTRRTAARKPHLADQIRAIVDVCALRDQVGRVALCAPRDLELALHPVTGSREWSGNNGKICYPDAAAAVAAAAAITRVVGADPVQAYDCPRGGHYHHVSRERALRRASTIIAEISAAARRAATR